jgi:hypothetical protein
METYIVIRFFSKLSENLKPYNVGDTIKLSKEEAEVLLKENFIELAKQPKAKK